MRKPRNLKLTAKGFPKFELEVGQRGQTILYLKPDSDTYIWIERRQINALKKWLARAEKWMVGNK